MATTLNRIPTFAYVEAQIVHRAAVSGVLKSFARDMEKEKGLQNGILGMGIFVETRIVSLLYLLILIPKEFWSLDPSHRIYSRLEKKFPLGDITIIVDKSVYAGKLYKFVHHLRNALAHAHFDFNAEAFEFWDVYRNQENYRARIKNSEMISFLEIVGSDLANYGTWSETIDES
jgi:hypothetical protein